MMSFFVFLCWMMYVDGMILVSNISMTFNDANDYCLSNFGTYLVSILSDDMNKMGYELCANVGDGMCWIGGYNVDKTSPTLFEWIDNSDSNMYSNWDDNEPNNLVPNDPQCISYKSDYKWGDISCDTALNAFICKCMSSIYSNI